MTTDQEELDLDTILDLLDEDEAAFPPEEEIEKSVNKPVSSSEKAIKAIKNNENASSKDNLKSQSDCAIAQRTKLKDVSVDLFSVETKETESSQSDSNKKSVVHNGENDSSDDEHKQQLSEEGRNIKRKIAQASNCRVSPQRRVIKTWKDEVKTNGISKKTENKNCMTDSFSGIRIINPLVPFNVLQERMQTRRMIKMSFIKNFIRGGDIEGDWVTIGVIVNKLPPKTSKNGKTYSIWKMTDLHDTEKIISVFLFGAAHIEHWKTAIGTVLGILNPSIMPDKNTSKSGEVTLSVDHAGKFMVLGTAKDFSHCKGKRKDGAPCTVVVNLSQCEYCSYHVKNEYRKLSLKRSELQTSYSGREPSLKNRILKKQNVIYGGQMFSPSVEKKPARAQGTKDKLTLSNLKLKRKAEELEIEERFKGQKKLTELYGSDAPVVNTNSAFINEQLSIPTVGARNLAQYLVKDQAEKDPKNKFISITPRQLLKNQEEQFKLHKSQDQKTRDNIRLRNLMPQLGKGFKPGQDVNLDTTTQNTTPKNFTSQDIAKLRAINKLKAKGPLAKKNPNSVKSTSPNAAEKVKTSLNTSNEEKDITGEESNSIAKSRLGSIDLNSKKIQEILNRKSSHAYEVEMEEIEKQETYFNHLEKKEQLEQKMAQTMEVVCDVVSCKLCKYTAHQASDRCKELNHPLKCHKAIKRFFCCNDCKHRTWAFTRIPTKSCRNCGGSSFERTCMMKPRSGPKLDSEILNIRGDEMKFLNSLSNEVF